MTNTSKKRPITAGSVLGLAILVVISGLVLEFLAVEPVPLDCALKTLAIWTGCLCPIWLWTVRKEGSLPMFELLCLAFGGAYAMPVFLQPNGILIHSKIEPFDWEQTSVALNLAFLGIASLIAGFYSTNRLSRGFLNPIDIPMANSGKMRAYLALLVAVGLVGPALLQHYTGAISGAITSALKSLVNAGIIVVYFYPKRIFEFNPKLVSYLLAGTAALMGLATGLLENAAIPLVLVAVAKWTESRKFPAFLFASMAAIFVLVNSVKREFRQIAWYTDETASASMVDNVGTWKDLISSSLAEDRDKSLSEKYSDRFRKTLARVDLVHTLAWVQSLTPQTVPYKGGETYKYILYGWIPRVLWPDKPVAQQANITFAVDYNLLHDWQTSTTMIGIGHIAEAFANFGQAGVFGAMFLEGAFLALLHSLLNGKRSQGGRAVFAGVMVYFFNGIGSATSMFFYLAIQLSVVNLFWLRCFADTWRIKNRGQDRPTLAAPTASPAGLPTLSTRPQAAS